MYFCRRRLKESLIKSFSKDRGAHSDPGRGPRAVLGPQRALSHREVEVNSSPPMRSDMLRAEDGSRSFPGGRRSYPMAVFRRALDQAYCGGTRIKDSL